MILFVKICVYVIYILNISGYVIQYYSVLLRSGPVVLGPLICIYRIYRSVAVNCNKITVDITVHWSVVLQFGILFHRDYK